MNFILNGGGPGKKAFSNSSFLGLSDTPDSYSGQAGKGARVNATEAALEFYTLVDTDEHVKVTAADTTPGVLNGKLVAGTNINLTVGNPGGDETLTVDCTAVDEKLKVTASDTTPDYLNNKILVGNGLDGIINNPGGNEQLIINIAHGITTDFIPKALNAAEWQNSDLSNVNAGQVVLEHETSPKHILTIGNAEFSSIGADTGALVYNVN